MLLNFELLKQPLNWLTIWLMIAIFALVIHLIFIYQLTPNPTDGVSHS